jgi:hypothetical protein
MTLSLRSPDGNIGIAGLRVFARVDVSAILALLDEYGRVIVRGSVVRQVTMNFLRWTLKEAVSFAPCQPGCSDGWGSVEGFTIVSAILDSWYSRI